MTLLRINSITLECVQGDIVDQSDMEAIVNAANARLLPGGGVAGAIHAAAGPGLAEECRPLAPIRTGEAVLTKGHRLSNRYVIHCLGPVYGKDGSDAILLANCYRNALRIADKHAVRSLAFPSISTGIFGYPAEEAARIALNTVTDELPELSSIHYIRFVLYSTAELYLYEQLFTSESRKKKP